MVRRVLTVVVSNLVLLVIAPVMFHAQAQTSPVELAQAVVERWSAGAEKNFASIYPFREGRDALAAAVGAKSRPAGLANVIRSSEGQAVLLISGVPLLPNSGDATALSVGFSGVYEARAEAGVWKLHTRIPLENMGQILAHDMKVSLRPGSGVTVEDRMRILVKGRNGFAVRLNHAAKIESVRAAGTERFYLFGGGLFWIELPEGQTELTIRYSIEAEKGPHDTNSGCFLENAGHLRNQYFWHPFFGFNADGAWADFHIEVRMPKEYRASTSIPQTERVVGSERIVEGKTIQPAFTLTLVYDRDWKVESRSFGGIRVEFFVTPEMQPNAGALFDEVRSVYSLLSGRFGALPAAYVAVVQARSRKDKSGWLFASNQAVVSAMNPGLVSMESPVPQAPFAHEIAHFWTQGATGPARNFLTEGWAVWAESAVLESKYGAEAAKALWRFRTYGAYDASTSLLEDESNTLVSYTKGAWLFHMLEDALGSIGFGRAIAEYSSRSLMRPAGWELLAECAQRYAPPNFDARSFLLPWLIEKRAPHLTAEIKGSAVTIHQEPAVFELPLVVEASTAQGPERHRVWIKGPETVVMFSGEVSNLKIDPDGSLLLRR